jgi:tRNA pseudouridine38-40 synthase
MARYQVILAYDGTDFFGFQRQAEVRTVQAVVETALNRLGWLGTSILAAGRTDTGVHARGQVIAFDLQWAHRPDDLMAALNANLPPDVAARGVTAALDDFHPRYDAVSRHYRYQVFCQPVRDPLKERYSWRIWPPVNLDSLNEAASYLHGEHDFSPFGKPMKPGGVTIRRVMQASWLADATNSFRFDIVANAYLYHMVRRIVKVLVSISQHEQSPAQIMQILAAPNSQYLQGLAPPNGLFLEAVFF